MIAAVPPGQVDALDWDLDAVCAPSDDPRRIDVGHPRFPQISWPRGDRSLPSAPPRQAFGHSKFPQNLRQAASLILADKRLRQTHLHTGSIAQWIQLLRTVAGAYCEYGSSLLVSRYRCAIDVFFGDAALGPTAAPARRSRRGARPATDAGARADSASPWDRPRLRIAQGRQRGPS